VFRVRLSVPFFYSSQPASPLPAFPLPVPSFHRAADDSDLLVKVIHVGDTTRVSLLSDNTKSIRSATWDPSGKHLVCPLFVLVRKEY
jgi:hypothetical protein